MLPQKPFYLIRHGQSLANIKHITAGGQFDSPLTPKGHDQALALAPLLTQLEIEPGHLYHSPMIRARDTAMHLNETLRLPATTHQDLREHDMGAWDGLPWADVLPYVEAGDQAPGGESQSMFAQRIQSIFTDILNNDKPTPPLIVAHGGLFFALGFLYEYGMMDIQNCHLHYFEPWPAFNAFPWRVWKFDIESEKLVKNSAPFCLSQALQKTG